MRINPEGEDETETSRSDGTLWNWRFHFFLGNFLVQTCQRSVLELVNVLLF